MDGLLGNVDSERRYAAHLNAGTNGKVERWHKSLKGECILPRTPLSLEDAQRLVKGCVEHYNNVRLNSAIGYITPKDMLAGNHQEIRAERDRKLEAARQQRKNRRQRAASLMKRITFGWPTLHWKLRVACSETACIIVLCYHHSCVGGRIRSAERVEAHPIYNQFFRTFFQPNVRTMGTR
jgi:hypothetical protein